MVKGQLAAQDALQHWQMFREKFVKNCINVSLIKKKQLHLNMQKLSTSNFNNILLPI